MGFSAHSFIYLDKHFLPPWQIHIILTCESGLVVIIQRRADGVRYELCEFMMGLHQEDIQELTHRHRWEMRHTVLRLPLGSRSFNCPNLTQERATARKKTYPPNLNINPNQNPNANQTLTKR
jgi:hypothetical protein